MLDPHEALHKELSDRYELAEVLGEGGMGTVYLARDRKHDRWVAIKTIHPERTNAEVRQRFQREIGITAQLQHPHILPLLDSGAAGETLYYVMPYVEGESLQSRLERDGMLSIEEAIPIAHDVAEALQHAHGRGVVHRDIKPGNIMLAGGNAVVTDFGIARAIAEAEGVRLTQTGLAIGSPAYMSPEQSTGERAADGRSDIYSLGCVLYEMLAGEPPFTGQSALEVIARSIREEAPPLGSKAEGVPPEVEGAVYKALAKVPEDRFETAEAFAQALTGGREVAGQAFTSAVFGQPRRIMAALFDSMKTRKIVRWAIAYVAGAWLLLEILGFVAENFGWPAGIVRGATVFLGVGFFVTLVLAWYHGEKGQQRATRFELLIIAGLLLVAGGAAAYVSRGSAPEESETGVPPTLAIDPRFQPRPSVAVIGFKNLSARPEVAWLSTALSEMLTTELGAGAAVRTVPGEVVGRMKVELSIGESESYSPETLRKIRQNLGSDFVVLGSFTALGDPASGPLRLDLRVQDTAAGETVASLSETGSTEQLFQIVSQAGERLRSTLGVGRQPVDLTSAVAASRPANIEAARLYAEGIEKLRKFDAIGSLNLLQLAVDADPDYALAHSALASAWQRLGHDANAQQEAVFAFERSESMPRQERLLIEAQYRLVNNEWEHAREIYTDLWESTPDNIEYGLGLVRALSAGGETEEAMSVVEVLKQLPPPLSEDARILLAEALTAEKLSDYERERAASATARTMATAQGAVLLVAESWFLEGRALVFAGEYEQSLAAFEESQRLYEGAGNRAQVATLLNAIGIVRRRRGEPEAALDATEEALGIKREIGEQGGVAMLLNSLGILAQQAGEQDRAEALYQEAMDINRELDNRRALITNLINLGNVRRLQADLASAQELLTEAASIAGEFGNRSIRANALFNLTGVLLDMGDLQEARRAVDESHRIFVEIDDPSLQAYALFRLGEIDLAEGDLVSARAMQDSSLAIRERLGARTVGESRREIGLILIENKRYSEAEVWIVESLDRYGDDLQAEDVAIYESLLARALAGQGRMAEALEIASEARRRVAESEELSNRLRVNITVADVRASAETAPEEKRTLEAVLREAERAALLPRQYAARLVLGKIELAYGEAQDGRARLDALRDEASRNGFVLIAAKAGQALAEH